MSPQEREVRLLHLLQLVWTSPITTKSDLAREYADEIAEAASRGFLTTRVVYGSPRAVWGRRWKVTAEGLTFLRMSAHLITTQEIAAYADQEEDHSAD